MVRPNAGHSRESFAVVGESNNADDPAQVRSIAHEVVTEVAARPRNVVVLAPVRSPRHRRENCAALMRCHWSPDRTTFGLSPKPMLWRNVEPE